MTECQLADSPRRTLADLSGLFVVLVLLVGCDSDDGTADHTTDQAKLAEIAMAANMDPLHRDGDTGRDGDIALNKLTDPALLSKVAVEAKDQYFRYMAYGKLETLADDEALAKLSTTADPATRTDAATVLMIRRACAAIPAEHRKRLRGEFQEIVHELSQPLTAPELGDIRDIHTTWEARQEDYQGGTVGGEAFTVSVKLSRVDHVVSRTWETRFPDLTQAGWINASIDQSELLEDIYVYLSEPTLAKVAREGIDSDVRAAASRRLAKLAKYSTSGPTRVWAGATSPAAPH